MKKILSLLCVATLLLSVTACGQSEDKANESSSAVATYENEIDLGTNSVRINGFESDRDMNSLMPRNYVGKLEVVTGEIVKSGNACAKVTVVKDLQHGVNTNSPVVFQSLENVSRQIYETNVTNTKTIEFWVYNAQDTTENVGVRPIVKTQYNWPGGPVKPTKWVKVPAKEWYKVEYEINLDIIPSSVGENGETIHSIQGVYITFARPSDCDKVFYLDDFYVTK